MSAPGAAARPHRSRILILPNRNSLGLGLLLLAMGYAGVSQGNAAAYLLGYLTLALALISVVHCWRNLLGLTVTLEPIPAVFAGEPVLLRVVVRQTASRRSLGVEISGGSQALRLAEVAADAAGRGELFLPPASRGCYTTVPLVLSSSYPLGFFSARQKIALPQTYYVYPLPEGELPLPADPGEVLPAVAGAHSGGSDFAGVRDWRPGESMRHIDWKAVARGQRLMIKQWSGGDGERLVLAWEALPGLAPEARLRQLARWIVLATRHGAAFELRLPGQAPLAFAQGEAHFHAALRALAQWGPVPS